MVFGKKLILFLIVVLQFTIYVEEVRACNRFSNFRIFDSTLYIDKPNLEVYGIEYFPTISSFWRPKPPADDIPSLLMIQKAIDDAKIGDHKRAFIDIEHWSLRGDVNEVYDSIIKYRYVIREVKDKLPNMLVGLYGMVPIRDYWRAIKPNDSPEFTAWKAENDRLSILVSEVDFLLPSLYTFYEDIDGWEKYAIANLKEARRISQGKPVYAFIWPQYHDSNRKLIDNYLPRNFWRKQLEIVEKYADGVVFWGGWQDGRLKWNNNMAWWQETLDWLQCDREMKPNAPNLR